MAVKIACGDPTVRFACVNAVPALPLALLRVWAGGPESCTILVVGNPALMMGSESSRWPPTDVEGETIRRSSPASRSRREIRRRSATIQTSRSRFVSRRGRFRFRRPSLRRRLCSESGVHGNLVRLMPEPMTLGDRS